MRRVAVPAEVRKCASRLRRRLKPQHPVVVRCGAVTPHCAADCGLVGDRFIITINPEEMGSLREWCETLAHEWAHALVWKIPSKQDHDDIWGAAYARCYCVVFNTR